MSDQEIKLYPFDYSVTAGVSGYIEAKTPAQAKEWIIDEYNTGDLDTDEKEVFIGKPLPDDMKGSVPVDIPWQED